MLKIKFLTFFTIICRYLKANNSTERYMWWSWNHYNYWVYNWPKAQLLSSETHLQVGTEVRFAVGTSVAKTRHNRDSNADLWGHTVLEWTLNGVTGYNLSWKKETLFRHTQREDSHVTEITDQLEWCRYRPQNAKEC